MRGTVCIAALSILASGCSSLSGNDKAEKVESKVAVKEVKHVDLNCTPESGQGVPQYAGVNRISIDLINNRIDLFSKDQIWQFHGVNDKSAGGARDIEIAYVGRNIAAWGIKAGTPFNFYYDTTKSAVTLAYLSADDPMSVTFACTA